MMRIEAISTALENELLERSFYLAHSKKTANPVGKKMFEQIAADEDEHYRRLEVLYQKLSTQGAWPDTIANNPGSSDILNTFRTLAARADAVQESTQDDLDAIKTAIDFETKAQSFYARLSSQAETDPEKFFFDLMASLEWEHLLTLQDALLFFESPHDWFAKHERPHYEG